jgi:cytochrome d ubiquinol oxidase subunit II
MAWWRRAWDVIFSAASFLGSFLMCVAFGNVIRGIPLDSRGEYLGGFLTLLNPYALLTGLTTIALFAMHGAIYLVLKTEGEVQGKIRGWVNNTIIVFVICYATTTMATLLNLPHMGEAFTTHPWTFTLPVATMLAIANVPREIVHGREWRAFLSSCAAVFGLMGLVGLGMYPNLVRGTDPRTSLSIYNAASSDGTLKTMLIIAAIGIPLVLAYTISIYWIFRGKVKLDSMSY